MPNSLAPTYTAPLDDTVHDTDAMDPAYPLQYPPGVHLQPQQPTGTTILPAERLRDFLFFRFRRTVCIRR